MDRTRGGHAPTALVQLLPKRFDLATIYSRVRERHGTHRVCKCCKEELQSSECYMIYNGQADDGNLAYSIEILLCDRYDPTTFQWTCSRDFHDVVEEKCRQINWPLGMDWTWNCTFVVPGKNNIILDRWMGRESTPPAPRWHTDMTSSSSSITIIYE